MVKTAKDKAKETVAKEREKARLKKAERQNAAKERQQRKKELRESKHEEVEDLEFVEVKQPAKWTEEHIKKLFELMDRSQKNQVSQRDVLMALKKHHPIRLLFGLVGSGEASALQKRLERIQEAFESGSGLGELAQLFTTLQDASGFPSAFHFDALLSACKTELADHAQAAVDGLPKEATAVETFTPSKSWSVVPPGAACPKGLEFRMDMETGQTLARLPHKKT